MFFTQEDYKKIEQYLKLNSRKDTDFDAVSFSDIKPTDWVAIIVKDPTGGADHINAIVSISDLNYATFRNIVYGEDERGMDIIEEIPTKDSSKLVKSNGVWHAINDPKIIQEHQLNDNTVSTRTIIDANVTHSKLSDNSVEGNNIKDGEITAPKLGQDVITKFSNIEEELGLPIQRTVTENVEIPNWLSGFVCAQGYDDGVTVFVKGKRYNASSEESRCTVLIDISKYSKLRYKRVVTTNERGLAGMCFYTDENVDSVISDAGELYVRGEELSWQYREINVPAGAKYVRFSWRLDLNETFSCEGIYTEKVYPEGIRQDVSKLKNDVNSLQSTTQDLEDKVGESSKSIIEENVSATWIADGFVCYRSVQEYVEGKTYNNSGTNKYSSFIDISKYSAIKYIRMITTRAEENILGGLCFYSDANEESVISGSGQGYIHGDAENSFYENEITVPDGARYVRFSCHKEFINDFYCKGIYSDYVYSGGLGKKVKEISDDVEEIKETLYQQEIRIDPVLCRRRFYLAMTEWCKSHNLSDSVIIEGAGGGGTGGEVEDEQLGHGLAQYKVGDAAKILFNAYSYDFIANALCEKVHIAYPKGATEGIKLKSTSYDYFESILPDYKPMVWKTGTGEKTVGINDESYCNLSAICNSEDFNGNLVLGVIRSAKSRNDRYVMFKALMDIAKKLINNDQAISSEVETLINAGQGTNLDGATVYGNAIAIKLPIGNPKAYHKIDFNDINNPYVIYAYNANTPIKTLSMIKLLTSMVVLDYVNDLDVFLTVTAEDKASVGPNGSGYNLFPEGCKMTIRDLLYAALLPSNNVACYVLARYVGQFLIETYGDKGFIPDTENNVTSNN